MPSQSTARKIADNARFLSAEQLAAFERDGFLNMPGAFSVEEMRDITRWTEEVQNWEEVPGRHMAYYEDSLTKPSRRVLQRIENFVPYHEGFQGLFTDHRMQGAVEQLFAEKAVLFKEKINFKLPGGDGFKPHQDSQAGWDKYADFFISVLVCIDEATIENGCLEVVSGHHKRGLFRSWEPMSEADMKGMNFVPVPTKPGDLIFFDCYAPHQSQPNFSDNIRRLYYATYNKLSAGDHQAQYYADKHKNYPPDIERDPSKTYVFRV